MGRMDTTGQYGPSSPFLHFLGHIHPSHSVPVVNALCKIPVRQLAFFDKSASDSHFLQYNYNRVANQALEILSVGCLLL